jgi:hypothetical protein
VKTISPSYNIDISTFLFVPQYITKNVEFAIAFVRTIQLATRTNYRYSKTCNARKCLTVRTKHMLVENHRSKTFPLLKSVLRRYTP